MFSLNRPKDVLHKAYSLFVLMKKKFQYNIYDSVNDILRDVVSCSVAIQEVKMNAEDEFFMKTEIPFLMN